ncbi:hypothetical protein AAFC00_003829 [Neodothiora populina]|uniref:Myo-inositol 2-dehydrogenase n=1 Tax=Neodothiora populina TaxID=2781224 RepID=A0ABR3PFL6_9PEZI
MADEQKKLRVGIVGAGEVAQVIHLPVLSLLAHLYSVSIICDISKKNADHCAWKFHIPESTTNPIEVITSAHVDVVFILTSDDSHADYTIAALEAGKDVMIEKPITLSRAAAQRIIDAEAKSGGKKVFVGYMRRYAASFTNAFMRELKTIPKILYARSRDFSGPNASFVDQSGTFQVKNTSDISPAATSERDQRLSALLQENFGPNPTQAQIDYCRFLGSLGSHDLSLMREALGFPESVVGVSVNEPFYSAIFKMRNRSGASDDAYFVTYESGIDGVPEFDAHLAVYGEKKRVSIQYDSPYVKGLPINVKVSEMNEFGEFQTREMLSSYEDAYTAEMRELWACLVEGKEIKTTATDALNELKLYDLMYEKYAAQGA